MKIKLKKIGIVFIVLLLIISSFMHLTINKSYAQSEWLSDSDVSSSEVANPEPDAVLPDANQYRYQKEELAAFVHFGPNTFNEIEWGEHYGSKTPTEIYRLSNEFQADEMVRVLKEAGFKKLIITAKHHDGFAIWDTKYSDYKATNSNNQITGEKDVLKIISAAATKYNMNMGLYLSPWDIHEKSYGYYDKNGRPTNKQNDYLDYNDFYNNQLEEILSNSKYGNNGHFNEVWMDGAKGSGANAQDYDFDRWFATIQRYEGKEAGFDADAMLFGADAYTTVRWIGNEHGLAAKNTWSKSKVDKERNTIDSNRFGQYMVGFENGNQWTVPEADARITSGWFWGTKKKTPKSLTDLAHMYFNSVGNNSVLLLNIPPNNDGYVDKEILDRVAEFGREIQASFSINLAGPEKATIKADKIRLNSSVYKPSNLIDKNQDTVWTTSDGENNGKILINFNQTTSFDIVSIEEAIQYGQRINSYTVEYRKNNGNWQTLDSGQTIGAKRLIRTGVIKADQIRISVSVPEGKVPILSEIGVYKSSKSLELSASAPDGIDVFDINNDNVFSFTGKWNSQEGPEFIGSSNKWANAGSSFTVKFTGSKIFLLGTTDPGHGLADIYIDGNKVETINTQGSTRKLGTMIYTSPDLTHGDHTLRLDVKTRAIGIEAAYVINNNGLGMIGFENNSYTMNEAERKDLKLIRIGGSTGRVSVRVSPNPGSAIQDDYNTELITTVTFEDGEVEKVAPVETRRNTNRTGDQNFVAEINAVDNKKIIIGFYNTAIITVKDEETPDTSLLRELTAEFQKQNSEWYLSQTWPNYQAAGEKGLLVLANSESTKAQVKEAVDAITAAKESLLRRESYTVDDPFFFPEVLNKTHTLEAEFATLHNSGDNERWPLEISQGQWASNNKYINSLNNLDYITIPYNATYPGIYQVKATYRSGSNANKLNYREENNKIREGSVSAGSNNASVTNTVIFNFEVVESGKGTLVFYGNEQNSPQLDKLEITLKDKEKGEIVSEKLHRKLDCDASNSGDCKKISLSLNKHKNLIYTLKVENLSNFNKTDLLNKYSNVSEYLPEILLTDKESNKNNLDLFEVSVVDESGNKVTELKNANLVIPLRSDKKPIDLVNVYHKSLALTKLNSEDDISMAAMNTYKIVGNEVVVKIDNLSPFTLEYKNEDVDKDNGTNEKELVVDKQLPKLELFVEANSIKATASKEANVEVNVDNAIVNVKGNVSYKDLEVGKEYILKLQLVEKGNVSNVLSTVYYNFVPNQKDGKEVVEFGNIELVANKSYILFESAIKKEDANVLVEDGKITSVTAKENKAFIENKDENNKAQILVVNKINKFIADTSSNEMGNFSKEVKLPNTGVDTYIYNIASYIFIIGIISLLRFRYSSKRD